MRERPIPFSAPMVRAILAGTKCQTRRVVKPQPDHPLFRGMLALDDEGIDLLLHDSTMARAVRCPYGKPGDRLWVKETTIKVEDAGWMGPVYAESEEGRFALDWGYGDPTDPDHIPPHEIKCRPSLFMSRAMARITLEVTGVRVERLQDISEADAIAEGVEPSLSHNRPGGVATHYGSYRRLWEQINGSGAWAANPWVWVVEFKRAETA